MNSDHEDISIVEGDMGEGFFDPIEVDENFQDKLQREQWKREERLKRRRPA